MARIIGTTGNDNITGSGEADAIFGGDGNDTIRDGYGDDVVDGGSGDDVLYDEVGNDQIYGGDGNDRIVSTLNGGQPGQDLLHGGQGNNSFEIRRSGTAKLFRFMTVVGLDGNDTVSIQDQEATQFLLNLGGGNDMVTITQLQTGSVASLTLGGGSDVIRAPLSHAGTIWVEDFTAGSAGDRLEWSATLGAFSNFDPSSQNPFATGHMRLLQNGADTLVEVDLDGGGNNFISWVTLANVTAASLVHQNLSGYDSDGTMPSGSTATGAAAADRLFGTAGADLVEGLGGDDELFGGAGGDTLRGGDGNDILTGDYGDDVIEGGAGSDLVYDGRGNDVVDGGDGNDTLVSDSGGSDELVGGAGLDQIVVNRSTGTDVVSASGGDDADSISLRFTAAGAQAWIDAGSGDDTVVLTGIAGTVAVTLGAGADRLRPTGTVAEFNAWKPATVTDFQPGDAGDMIDLNLLLRSVLTGWDTTNPFATGHVRLVQNGADAVLEVSRDANAANFRPILTLTGTSVGALTTRNLYGWPTDGSAPPGLTVNGTARGESIEATYGNDVVHGLDGRDLLVGGLGDDVLYGDAGDDSLRGGHGNDRLIGGDGADELSGQAGNDEVHGGEGNDTIFVYEGEGRDRAFGDAGDDLFFFYSLPLEVDGGDGDDHVLFLRYETVSTDLISIRGGGGNDTFHISQHNVALLAVDMGSGNDTAIVFAGMSASITLGADSDRLVIENGGVTSRPPEVIEVLDFAAGDRGDYFEMITLVESIHTYAYGTNPFASGHARLVQNGADTMLQTDADGTGTQHGWTNVVIFRNTAASAFTLGNFGFGTDAADTIRLDFGVETTAFSGRGDDVLYMGAHFGPGDYIDGGDGTDSIILHGDYSAGFALEESSFLNMEHLFLLSGTETSFGGSGTATYDYVLSVHDENVEAGLTMTVSFRGLVAGETVVFDASLETDASYVFLGGAGDDVLIGGAQADLLDGGTGRDTLAGGLGNDGYLVDSVNDQVLEEAGEGTDEIRTGLGSRVDFSQMYRLPANVENLLGTSDAGQGIYLNALDNLARLGAGADLLVLEDGGIDNVDGGGGDDFLYYGAALTAEDSNQGGAGYDAVGLLGRYDLTLGAGSLLSIEKLAVYSSGVPASPNSYSIVTHDANVGAGLNLMVVGLSLTTGESLVFNGSAETNGSFNLRAGKGTDSLTGGAKSDQLYGNLGADLLAGGGGKDYFEYLSAAESTAAARDTIVDFAVGDRINLRGIDADANAANGDSRFSWIGAGAFTGQPGQLRASQVDGGWLVEGDTNGDGAADLVILVQTAGGHILAASDFML